MGCEHCINILKDIYRTSVIVNKGPHNETQYTTFPHHRTERANNS